MNTEKVSMSSEAVIAVRVTIVTLVVTGILYPLVMTGLAQALFAAPADGSVVYDSQHQPLGSALIGQAFSSPAYLQPRPSAAGANGYDATASSGSNLGPTSEKLHARVKADVERLQSENPDAKGPVPADLVTASASGLDPHVTRAGALWQAPRIAQARGVELARIERLIEQRIEEPTFGLLGEPRLNVLLFNQSLDKLLGKPTTANAATDARP